MIICTFELFSADKRLTLKVFSVEHRFACELLALLKYRSMYLVVIRVNSYSIPEFEASISLVLKYMFLLINVVKLKSLLKRTITLTADDVLNTFMENLPIVGYTWD